MQRALTLLCYVSLLSRALATSLISEEDERSERSRSSIEWNPTLHPFAGAQVTVESLETQLYCGHQDLSTVPKCIHYSYKSNALIETFIVDKDAYTMLQDTGGRLHSDGVILPGSYCLGEKCEITADLQGVERWCLMFLNVEPRMSTASVSFSYQVCVEEDNDKHLILILSITCIGLLVVAFVACLGCCWMQRRRKRDNSRSELVTKAEAQQPATVPLLPPPTHLNRFGPEALLPPPPPMVSHAPFRHEPAFQIQPPLPLSRPPPPSSSAMPPPQASGQEMHVQFRQPERKRRPKSATKIRFPI